MNLASRKIAVGRIRRETPYLACANHALPVQPVVIVRIQDGNIVAIGGLMQMESNRTSSGLPGSTDVPFLSSILGNKANSGRKKELVVLIKPTIIRNAQDWEAQTRRTRSALDDMDSSRARVIRLDGAAYNVEPARAR